MINLRLKKIKNRNMINYDNSYLYHPSNIQLYIANLIIYVNIYIDNLKKQVYIIINNIELFIFYIEKIVYKI